MQLHSEYFFLLCAIEKRNVIIHCNFEPYREERI